MSLDSDLSISTNPNSPSTSNVNPNTKKREGFTGLENPKKRQKFRRKTTVKQHLDDEIYHSSQWLAGIKKSINDCIADLVAIKEKKAIFLAEIEEEKKKVTLKKNEFIDIKNSMVAWGAQEEGVSEEWKSG